MIINGVQVTFLGDRDTTVRRCIGLLEELAEEEPEPP